MTFPQMPELDMKDAQIYATCMVKVRQRIGAIKWLVASNHVFGAEHFLTTELIFVQFRKVLELIAFASLSANKARYSEAYDNFQDHWQAKRMLAAIEKINPKFYPEPVGEPISTGDKSWRFQAPPENALTRDDFVRLYDASSQLLHMRNPFSAKDPVTDIGYSVDEWVLRIQRLLGWHYTQLLDGSRWMVNIPTQGDVRVFPAEKAPDSPPVTNTTQPI